MATLTVKNIPDPLYKMLKRQAARRHRSLNQEIISCLEQAAALHEVDPQAILWQARALRQLYTGTPLTEERLNRLKRAGRL